MPTESIGKECCCLVMRLAKVTDYGIVLLTHFARDVQAPWSARALSEVSRLPLPVVSKILKALVHHGMLVSERGARGGYRLARHPDHISVADIICALDGPIALTDCSDHLGGGCTLERLCPARTNLQKINRAVRDALAELSLTRMMHPLSPCLTIEEKETATVGGAGHSPGA